MLDSGRLNRKQPSVLLLEEQRKQQLIHAAYLITDEPSALQCSSPKTENEPDKKVMAVLPPEIDAPRDYRYTHTHSVDTHRLLGHFLPTHTRCSQWHL